MTGKKLVTLTLVMVFVLGLAGVVMAVDPAVTETEYEKEYLAAPAVAGELLEEAGIDNRYGTGRDGGNFIRDVAHKMNEDSGTDFNGVPKTDVEAYKREVALFLRSLGADVGAYLFEAVLESVVYEGVCDMFGSHVGDLMTFTFSNDIFKDGDIGINPTTNSLNIRDYGSAYLEVMTLDIVDNVLVVEAIKEFGRPRDTDDLVTVINGLVDSIGNPVVVPEGGVAIEVNSIYPTLTQDGTFTSHSNYYLPGEEWNYSIAITVDCYGGFMSGTIVLEDHTGDQVIADIEDVKYDYTFWSNDIPNVAAVGQATYLGKTYYFMALYAERALWMALSDTSYQSRWESGSVYISSERAYNIHSTNTYDFPIFWQ